MLSTNIRMKSWLKPPSPALACSSAVLAALRLWLCASTMAKIRSSS